MSDAKDIQYAMIADDREREVADCLKALGIDVKVQRIAVGDFAIVSTDDHAGTDSAVHYRTVIERKTLHDFAASMQDGRLDNISKLLTLRDNHPGCVVILIIEHKLPWSHDGSRYGRVPWPVIQRQIYHLMFKHGIQVIRTRNRNSTAQELRGMMNSLQTIDELLQTRDDRAVGAGGGADAASIGGGASTVVPGLQELIEHQPKDINMLRRKAWLTLPGVTNETLAAWCKKYTLTDVIEHRLADADVAHVMTKASILRRGIYPTPATAYSKFEGYKNLQIRLLACARGVSRDMAKAMIASAGTVRALLSRGADGISMISLLNGRRVGDAAAKNIVDLFQYELAC